MRQHLRSMSSTTSSDSLKVAMAVPDSPKPIGASGSSESFNSSFWSCWGMERLPLEKADYMVALLLMNSRAVNK